MDGFPNPPTLHHSNRKIIILNVIFLSNNKLNLPKGVIKNKWEHASAVVVSISPDMAAQVKKSHWKPMGNKFILCRTLKLRLETFSCWDSHLVFHQWKVSLQIERLLSVYFQKNRNHKIRNFCSEKKGI